MYGAHAMPDVLSVPMLISKLFSNFPDISKCIFIGLFYLETRISVFSSLHMLAELLQCRLEELPPPLRLLEVVLTVVRPVCQPVFSRIRRCSRNISDLLCYEAIRHEMVYLRNEFRRRGCFRWCHSQSVCPPSLQILGSRVGQQPGS